MRKVWAALILAAGVLPAAAQNAPTGMQSVLVDLDGDGRAESFTLRDADGSVDLVIEGGTGGTVVAKNIAWKGGIGQQPELGLSAGGSVTLTSMNDAIGRSRWHLTLTIAYRRGAYRAAGVTYDAYDTLDLGAAMTCDLNLLNGKGFLETASGKTEVRTTLTARPVTEWKEDEEMPPPGCR